jgi:hypothetical protein
VTRTTIAMPGEPGGKGRPRARAAQPVTFVVRLAPAPGSSGIRELRAVLKTLLRRHHVRCISAVEEQGRETA